MCLQPEAKGPRTGRADGTDSYAGLWPGKGRPPSSRVRREVFLFFSLVGLFRPSTDWMRPTCIGAAGLLSSACRFKC